PAAQFDNTKKQPAEITASQFMTPKLPAKASPAVPFLAPDEDIFKMGPKAADCRVNPGQVKPEPGVTPEKRSAVIDPIGQPVPMGGGGGDPFGQMRMMESGGVAGAPMPKEREALVQRLCATEMELHRMGARLEREKIKSRQLEDQLQQLTSGRPDAEKRSV